MLRTFEFIFYAQRDVQFMKKIRSCIEQGTDEEICTDIHRINFSGARKSAIVRPLSADSPFHHKIAPKEISYKALLCMLEGNWDGVSDGDICDIE